MEFNQSALNTEKIETEKNAKDIWKECLSIIKDNVPYITYNTWFLPIKPYELENNTDRKSVV